jgi:hypothetical protein
VDAHVCVEVVLLHELLRALLALESFDGVVDAQVACEVRIARELLVALQATVVAIGVGHGDGRRSTTVVVLTTTSTASTAACDGR